MSITTKTGDQGMTSLWSGERVEKDNARVEAYGTIDELNSFVGENRHYCELEEVRTILLRIQRELFQVAGQLASKDKPYLEPITEPGGGSHDDRSRTGGASPAERIRHPRQHPFIG